MEQLPEYLSWFGIEQILWVCARIMLFIYAVVPNVVGAIVLYAVFSNLLFLPFSIKAEIDSIKNARKRKEMKELEAEFLSIPEEEREKEEVKESFRKRKKKITGKGSTAMGCLLVVLRIFILLATMPVITYMGHFVNLPENAWMFLGFDLTTVPGWSFTPSLIFPLFTALVLAVPNILSVKKNIKMQEEMSKKKTEEEKEEEEKLLKEMGIKDKKFAIGYVVQIVFAVLYFIMFSRISLALSLFWGVYYLIGFGVRRVIALGFSKIAK